MAESTDQRIQKILQSKAKEKEAADLEKKLAKDRSNKRQETAERVRQKWTADTYIIARGFNFPAHRNLRVSEGRNPRLSETEDRAYFEPIYQPV